MKGNIRTKIFLSLVISLSIISLSVSADHVDYEKSLPAPYDSIVTGIITWDNGGSLKDGAHYAFVDYRNTNPSLEQYTWKYAYVRKADDSPSSLDDYIKKEYEITAVSLTSDGSWFTDDGLLFVDDLPGDDEWLIFGAGCVLRSELETYTERTGKGWFYQEVDSLSNNKWVCGFNKPISYTAPKTESNLVEEPSQDNDSPPPTFE